ncbi:MAG: glycosyltransferase [Chloroflexi bacterium]|jgi:hypothetical protein|nr:glycosyltransferase [Chloroflexota bacterium]
MSRQKLRIVKPPHRKFTMSACMIVKNEAANLEKCLSSIDMLVDEIVIVDTGSTDGTQGIARQFTKVRLFEPEPIMFMEKSKGDDFDRIDFSANRNVAIKHCTGDWIFIIDGDEFVQDIGDMRLLVKQANKAGVDHIFVNLLAVEDGHHAKQAQIRFFKNTGKFHYKRPVHNQAAGYSIDKAGMVGEFVVESEYRKEVREQEKEDRSEPMLLKAIERYPGEVWPHHYLAGLYLGRREPKKALPFAKIVVETQPEATETLRAHYIYAYATLMTKGLDEAEVELYKSLRIHPHFADLHMLRTVFSFARWGLTTEGHDPETEKYNTTAQKSHSVDFAAVAAVLGIPWPYLQVRKVDTGDKPNGKKPKQPSRQRTG